METGAITSYIDVAQVVLYAFWIFFAGLIYWIICFGMSRYSISMERRLARGHKN